MPKTLPYGPRYMVEHTRWGDVKHKCSSKRTWLPAKFDRYQVRVFESAQAAHEFVRDIQPKFREYEFRVVPVRTHEVTHANI